MEQFDGFSPLYFLLFLHHVEDCRSGERKAPQIGEEIRVEQAL
jgi:hypothetical protein